VTDLTGLADQVVNQGPTGQVINGVTGAAGQVLGGTPVGGGPTKRLQAGKSAKSSTTTTSKAKKRVARKATSRAALSATRDDDVTGQLLSRLNPFRAVGGQG
jgi:hypothetical protein